MQLHLNLIITPLMTGFVGYITNALAIKMLFRPHKRRWYSFGWQGVIPRNRGKLAKEIGKLVGNELIQEDDVVKSIKNEQFQSMLSEFIRRELKKIIENESDLYIGDIFKKFDIDIKYQLLYFFESASKKEDIKESISLLIDQFVVTIVQFLQNKTIGDILSSELLGEGFYERVIRHGKWQKLLCLILKEKLYNGLYSGHRLSELLPENVVNKFEDLADVIALKMLEWVRQALNDPITKIKITRKLITVKNDYFGGSFFDQLKLGVMNMFLSDEKITQLVENELPKLINAISEDNAIQSKLKSAIADYLKNLTNKPLHHYVAIIGVDNIHELLSRITVSFENYLRSEKFFYSIKMFLDNAVNSFGNVSLKDFANKNGIDLELILKRFITADLIYNNSNFLAEQLGRLISGINISSLFKNVREDTFDKIAVNIQNEINMLLDRNIPGIVKNLNIPFIVEQRINSLNLYQVEGLLFSFMSDQFEWINILGFVLGFLVGLCQSIIIALYGG